MSVCCDVPKRGGATPECVLTEDVLPIGQRSLRAIELGAFTARPWGVGIGEMRGAGTLHGAGTKKIPERCNDK